MQTPARHRRINPHFLAVHLAFAGSLSAVSAHAVSSAEVYTTKQYQYGRYEARMQFGAGDGIISSFFLWKDGSEMSSVFWNELDFEKLRANCALETNAIYGKPEELHSQVYTGTLDLCGTFHTYAYEWTPDYIAWFIDGVEIRRDTGATATAYRDNAPNGMQLRFNIWPGDESFGGTFNPKLLPVHEYINWVQYSSYSNGTFTTQWREDFNGTSLPAAWSGGNWDSPKGLSKHSTANVTLVNGYLVLSLTADDATGAPSVAPLDPEDKVPAPNVAPLATSVTSAAASGSVTTAVPSANTTGSGLAPTGKSDSASCQTTPGLGQLSWSWVSLGFTLIGLHVRRRFQER